MKKTVWIALGFGLLALLVFWILFGQGANSDNGKFTIETATVTRGDVAKIVSASGAVRPLTTVEVGSQVSGQILALHADFNSQVTKGQIIARIDDQTFQSRVASAKAEVTSARANIEVQGAQINRAKANLDTFQKDHARQSALYEQDAIALSLLEGAKRQLMVAQSDLAVSKAQYLTGQAALTQRLASLQTQQVDLERTIIRSPITGVVIERNVDVGQTVAASLAAPVLFRIAQDLSDIRIDVAVVESDIGGIDAADPVTFTVDAYPNDQFTGTVEQVRLASQEIQNVVTYTIVVAAQNRGAKLLPGMTANVEITTEKRKNVLRIAEAVSRFRPPAEGVQIIEVSNEGQSSRQRGGRRSFGGQILTGLDLDPERKQAIEAQIAQEISAVRNSMGDRARFRRDQMRQMMAARIERVLKKNLSAEEFKQYKKKQNSRPSIRRIELFTDNSDGSLSKKTVAVGLSDGSNMEIIRGASEGDAFVVRLLKTDKAGK